MATIEVCVGRIGKPHGVRGEVTLEVRTDEPQQRFAVGQDLVGRSDRSSPPRNSAGVLTVVSTRWHQGRLLARFAQLTDRNAAESARGLELFAAVDPERVAQGEDEFYDHQLEGLRVCLTTGESVGTVTAVQHGRGQDLLVIDARVSGGEREVLVPFVSELVPTVDLRGGELRVADRPGLLWAVPDEAGSEMSRADSRAES